MTVTTEQRALWRRLAAEATPGPWCDEGDGIGMEPGREPWHVTIVGTETSGPAYMESTNLVLSDPDRAFVAAAREAVPALLLALERAEGELEAMKDRDYAPVKAWILEHAPETVQTMYRIMVEAESERDALALRVRGLEGMLDRGDLCLTCSETARAALSPPATPGATPTNRNEE